MREVPNPSSNEKLSTNLQPREVYSWVDDILSTGVFDPETTEAEQELDKIEQSIAGNELLADMIKIDFAAHRQALAASRRAGLDDLNRAIVLHGPIGLQVGEESVSYSLTGFDYIDGRLQAMSDEAGIELGEVRGATYPVEGDDDK